MKQILTKSYLLLFLLIITIASLKIEQQKSFTKSQQFKSPLPYQAHSFNDLDYFVNLFKKGTTYYKIDVSLADRQSCQKFSTWNSTKNQQPPCKYYPEQYSYEICCLGLRGDASSQPKLLQHFNTSSDFVSMVRNKLLGDKNFSDRKLFVAMNFQFRFYFDEGIIQGFVNKLTKLMKQFQGRLDIGFGQDFILDYDQICMGNVSNNLQENYYDNSNGYNQLKQIKCTQERFQASKTPYFLQSSSMNPFNSKDIYKRYRNFNTFFRDAEKFCNQGFPKWITNYPNYPLIFWEPSNQKQIQWVLQTVLSQKCKQKHGKDINGIAIASNLDPQMFSHYMLKSKINTQSSIKQWNDYQEKLFLNYSSVAIGSNQKLLFVGYSQKNGKSWMNIYQKNDQRIFKNKKNLFKISNNNENIQNIPFNITQKIPIDIQSGINGKITQILTLKNTMGIVIDTTKQQDLKLKATSQAIILYQLKTQPYSLQFITLFSITNHISTKIVFNQNNQRVVYILRLNIEDDYTIFTYNLEKRSSSVWTTFQNEKNFDITDFQIIQEKDISDRKIVFVGYYDGIIKYSTFLMKNKTFIDKQINLTYGNKPKIVYNSQQQMITILIQNSMCQSAILANNNQINKCLIPQNPKYKNLTNIPSVINQVVISLQDLLQFKNRFTFPIAACSQSKMNNFMKFTNVAKIFQGKNIDLTYLSSQNNIYVISKYVPISQQGLFNGIFCGGSNYINYGQGYYLFKLKSL